MRVGPRPAARGGGSVVSEPGSRRRRAPCLPGTGAGGREPSRRKPRSSGNRLCAHRYLAEKRVRVSAWKKGAGSHFSAVGAWARVLGQRVKPRCSQVSLPFALLAAAAAAPGPEPANRVQPDENHGPSSASGWAGNIFGETSCQLMLQSSVCFPKVLAHGLGFQKNLLSLKAAGSQTTPTGQNCCFKPWPFSPRAPGKQERERDRERE